MSGSLAGAATQTGQSTAGALGSSLLALIVVIALILALAWIIRRLPGIGPRGHASMRVVGTLAVGVKERVMVIEIGEQQMVIGVTGEQITLLDKLEQPLPEQPMQKPDFSAVLERFKKGKPS